MKHSNRLLLVSLGLVALTTLGMKQGVIFRRTLSAGDSQTYHMEFKSNQGIEMPDGSGKQHVTGTGSQDMTESIDEVDSSGESATVTIRLANIKMDVDSPLGSAPKDFPSEATSTATVDRRNRFTNVVLDPVLSKLFSDDTGVAAWGGGVEFPEGHVELGESWDNWIPKMGMMSAGATLKATLIASDTLNGVPVWEIHLKGEIPVDVDMSKMPMSSGNPLAGQPARMKGTLNVSSVIFLDRNTNLVVKSTTTTESKMNVIVPNMDIEMPVTGDTETTVTKVAG